MGFRCMERVAVDSKQKGSALVLLVALAERASDHTRSCCATNKELAEDCRVHPRTIRRIVNRLQAAGELRVDLCAGPFGINRFTLILAPEPRQSPSGWHVVSL